MPLSPISFHALSRFLGITMCLIVSHVHAQVTLTSDGQPQVVILTRPNPPGYIQLAAQEMQEHVQRMSGAVLPLDVAGTESSYPGMKFVYVGASAATLAAGISTTGLELEFYVIRTIGGNLHIVGRDGGDDQWHDLSDCQPGTLFGVYHLLGDVLGVRWIWPGESGRLVPSNANVVVPALSITAGPALVQRKFRTPRIGAYLNGTDSYGFGIPVLPESDTRKTELAMEELLWLRRMRMGTRKNVSFAHSFTQWWSLYGVSHPEYFAELLSGRTQPHPAADRVKLHESSPAVWQQRIDAWIATGAGGNVNICPNDSRSFCICSECRAWDRPAQAPEIVFSSSEARLSDRMARFYTEIANRVKVINPNATVYGYAYDVYQQAPLEAMVPDNVALAYIPDAPSDVNLSGITATEDDVLGWIAHGCTQMYLRPNWMLSGHAGPYWPTHRVGEHFKRLLLSGNIKGFDSDSSCSSYATFGLYYYIICRLIADPSLPVETILDEYCSAFGSASGEVRNYLTYWENFINVQADAGNDPILGWSSCVAAYGGTYNDRSFDEALQILDRAYAALSPGETDAKARLDFLRLACLHGRLTAQAISLVSPTLPLSSNPQAEMAMRALLAFRDQHAESFALWREWAIDRESFVPNMENYWAAILATPNKGYGSNVGAFIETGGQVAMEAEHATATQAGTGAATGQAWQEITGVAGASGSVMQALPNNGTSTDTQSYGPRLDFKIDFHTAGSYYIFLHMPTHAGTDDSLNIGLDGTLVEDNMANTTGSWRWRTTNPATIALNIAAPGVRTFNIWMREDGVMVDKIILTTNSALALPGTDLGPTESGKRGSTEHLLTVGSGSGDGFYGESSMVAINASAAPPGYVFDRWAGVTASVTDHMSASTYVTMGPQDITVAATYRVDPALDTDNDGLPDSWEINYFTNINTASSTPETDNDGDGASDLSEFIAGTNPDDRLSHLHIKVIDGISEGDLTIQWQSVVGKTYTLQSSTTLQGGEWTTVAIGIPGAPSFTRYLLPFASSPGFFRVLVE